MTKFLALLILIFSLTNVSGQIVYARTSGAKYHKADCRSGKNISTRLNLKPAIEKGLTACKICKPPAAVVYRVPLKKILGEGNTVQSKGQTKAGKRYKHMTRIGNGYCFQHQPK